MSNSTRARAAGPGEVPEPTVLDAGQIPDAIPEQIGGGTVVLLLVAGAERAWAAEVAVELSAAWAARGRRVVLTDLHLENPILHERLGMGNLEGVVDLFLYGASIARSARPVRDRGFYLISAGTYEPDAEAIYRHPRWPKLVTGFRDAGASLVLFAPAESVDLEALAKWASEVVVLGVGEPRSLLEPLQARGKRIALWLVPPAAAPPPAREPVPAVEAGEAAPAPEPVEPPGAPAEPEPVPPTAATPVEPVAAPATVPEPAAPARATALERPSDPEAFELTLPPTPVRAKRRRRRGPVVLLVVLLLAVLLAGAGFVLSRLRPDLLPWMPGATPEQVVQRPAVPPPAPPPAASPVGESLPYSVQAPLAYHTFPAALEKLAAERVRLADVPLFISPEEEQGLLYYKLFAGALADTASANALRERLVSAGALDEDEAVGSWDLVKRTPLAFELGEYASPEAAAGAVDSLLARGISAYVLRVPYSDGSGRWQLYAGAFADSVGGEALRQSLARAGIQAQLVLRVGEPAPIAR